MKTGKGVAGCFVCILAAVVSTVFAVAVIYSDSIMFDRRNMSFLIEAIVSPVILQLIIYLFWFITNGKKRARNTDELARKSLLWFGGSALISCLLLIALACGWLLWEEGSMFLAAAIVLYVLSAFIQYTFCRPY